MSGDAKEVKMPENPIISFGDLTKPATVLIEKISAAVGTLHAPRQVVRMAEAEAKAAEIQMLSQIHLTSIQNRALQRFIEEEGKRQRNIEEIASQALPQLTTDAKPDKVDDDWMVNFFDKCRLISDKEMQSLWSRILAGEANEPGSYSKRTINFLNDLDKTDAEMFANLCCFCSDSPNTQPLIYELHDEIFIKNGMSFPKFAHLESIGLIKLQPLTGFVRTSIPKRVMFSYFGNEYYLVFPKNSDNQMNVGRVIFTKLGLELVRVCEKNRSSVLPST